MKTYAAMIQSAYKIQLYPLLCLTNMANDLLLYPYNVDKTQVPFT